MTVNVSFILKTVQVIISAFEGKHVGMSEKATNQRALLLSCDAFFVNKFQALC